MKLNNRDIKQILGAKSFRQSLGERIEKINKTRRNGIVPQKKKCKKRRKPTKKRRAYTRKNLGFMNF
jgi:hypothetical protein